MAFYFDTDSIMPTTGGAEINNQDITVKANGTYIPQEAGTFDFYAYPVNLYTFPSVIGQRLWVAGEEPQVGATVYNSKLDENDNPVLDLSAPLGKVTTKMWYADWQVWIFKVDFDSPNTWIYRPSNAYPIEHQTLTYTGLGTVTVNTIDNYLNGSGIPSYLTSNAKNLINYAMYGKDIVSVTLPECINIGVEAFNICGMLEQAIIPKYMGNYLDEDTGELYQEGSDNIFANCWSLQYVQATAMNVIPFGFFSGIQQSIYLSMPNLVGFHASAFGISWQDPDWPSRYSLIKGSGIDLTQMKYIGGNGSGDYWEGFIEDSDNNVTDTLSLPDLITIGQGFTSCEMTTRTYLDNITTLNIPNVKRVESWAAVELPITTIDLPSVISIGNNAFICPNATTINIGSDVVDINSGAFNNCPNVTTININKAQDSIAGAPWGAGGGAATVNWTGA